MLSAYTSGCLNEVINSRAVLSINKIFVPFPTLRDHLDCSAGWLRRERFVQIRNIPDKDLLREAGVAGWVEAGLTGVPPS